MSDDNMITAAEFVGLRSYVATVEEFDSPPQRSKIEFKTRMAPDDFRFVGFVYGKVIDMLKPTFGTAINVLSVEEVTDYTK